MAVLYSAREVLDAIVSVLSTQSGIPALRVRGSIWDVAHLPETTKHLAAIVSPGQTSMSLGRQCTECETLYTISLYIRVQGTVLETLQSSVDPLFASTYIAQLMSKSLPQEIDVQGIVTADYLKSEDDRYLIVEVSFTVRYAVPVIQFLSIP